MFVNPKDYTNFILSYDVALCFWRNKKTKEKYKEQYLQVIRENSIDGSGIYTMATIKINNDQRHGKYTSYYENGQVNVDTTYKNNKIHGKYVSYYENGQLREDTTYQNSRICGRHIEYYENGQMWIDTVAFK
jgi:antitoxin component YwqK of YwqJK toxin-antitoxin module